MHTIDVTVPADRNVMQKEAEKKIKYKRMYTEKTNLEYEMYDYTGKTHSHQNSNKRYKEKSGSHTRKTFNRFTTKDSYTWNTTHSTGGAAG